mmetsp:Transcript_6045/g.11564  ORF Transcript_6045/g.11564 Transcript_6045/m.11564 type:complete len:759 (+) Transcript_6045:60-2336(+)
MGAVQSLHCFGRAIKGQALNLGKEDYVDYLNIGKEQFFQYMPDSEVPPRLSSGEGLASEKGTPPTTLPKLVMQASEKSKDKPALMVERPLPPLDDNGKAPPALPLEEWTKYSYGEYLESVRNAAAGMIQLGFKRFDSLSIWGFNSPEWVMGAVAASFAGGKVAGLYPTDSADTAAYKVGHSGASIVLVEDRGKISKLLTGLKERGTNKVLAFVTWGFEPAENETVEVPGRGNVKLLSWQKLLELGKTDPLQAEVDSRIAATKPGHCAALIYTSGTTGEPKAVMISHDNLVFESNVVINMIQNSAGIGTDVEGERLVSYLPLSHVAGMMVDIIAPILLTATHDSHMTAFFARPYDLKAGTIKDRLCAARPTLFLGVPLVWEKIADKLRTIGAAVSDTKKAVASWAKGKGLEHAKACQLGEDGSYPLGYTLADKLVLGNIKAALGLDCCKFGFTGAAPIRVDTLEYFGSLGLQINEVYGMSECAGACTWSLDECHQWGSCGFEVEGVEVKAFRVDEVDMNKKTECPRAPTLDDLDEQYQGELCFRGRNIMMGYMACPELGSAHIYEIEKKNRETIDTEGWLHSGDKGLITEKGMVKITGRYKELIIGDGGENIAPVPIENHVKKMCDGISEIMMIGDKRKYNVALITLKAVGAGGETPGTDQLDAGAKTVNPEVTTISAAMDDKIWISTLTEAINSANNNPKVCLNPTFKIQKFTILPDNFSEEKNQLTPTKKVKRKAIEDQYKDLITKMYSTKGTYIRF